MKYLKLGEKASSFSDPISGIDIAGKEVIEVTPEQELSKKLRQVISGGGLIHATKDEYTEYLKSIPKKPSVTEELTDTDTKLDLDGKTREELLAYAENDLGFIQADMKILNAIKSPSQLIKKIEEIHKEG